MIEISRIWPNLMPYGYDSFAMTRIRFSLLLLDDECSDQRGHDATGQSDQIEVDLKVYFKVYLQGNFHSIQHIIQGDNPMTIIGLKELSQNAGRIAERVQNGERFTVVKRSKPVFDIVPNGPDNTIEMTKAWTRKLVGKHRPAFDALAKK
jgi:antitoxin (DNA-binding transcriptional repressor) of toxin-antitoxin stability system